MMIESYFHFRDMPRWNLGWATPNYAGAFIATALPWCWMMGGRWGRVQGAMGGCRDAFERKSSQISRLGTDGATASAILVLEAIGYFLLAKTYSRGALVSLGSSTLFFVLATGWSHWKASWRTWLLRALVAAGCVVGTGFWGRIGPRTSANDGSVENRLELWRGGLEMITLAPLSGWGGGESGRIYMNWFQEIERSEAYTTMVNSYVHIGVEYGLIVLGAVMSVLAWLMLLAVRDRRKRAVLNGRGTGARWLVPAAGASLVAWAVANIFTTLWIEPLLWVVPALAVMNIAIGSLHASWREWRRTIGFGLATGAAAAIAFFFAGVWFRRDQVLEISPDPRGSVAVNRRGATVSGRLWDVWPDPRVLGKTPGKELKRWISREANGRFRVYREGVGLSDITNGANRVLLFGRQVARYEAMQRPHVQLGLIHPSIPPPARTRRLAENEKVELMLPEIDELGLNAAWLSWAEAVGAQVIVSKGVGQDIRAAWPDIMQSLEKS